MISRAVQEAQKDEKDCKSTTRTWPLLAGAGGAKVGTGTVAIACGWIGVSIGRFRIAVYVPAGMVAWYSEATGQGFVGSAA